MLKAALRLGLRCSRGGGAVRRGSGGTRSGGSACGGRGVRTFLRDPAWRACLLAIGLDAGMRHVSGWRLGRRVRDDRRDRRDGRRRRGRRAGAAVVSSGSGSSGSGSLRTTTRVTGTGPRNGNGSAAASVSAAVLNVQLVDHRFDDHRFGHGGRRCGLGRRLVVQWRTLGALRDLARSRRERDQG